MKSKWEIWTSFQYLLWMLNWEDLRNWVRLTRFIRPDPKVEARRCVGKKMIANLNKSDYEIVANMSRNAQENNTSGFMVQQIWETLSHTQDQTNQQVELASCHLEDDAHIWYDNEFTVGSLPRMRIFTEIYKAQAGRNGEGLDQQFWPPPSKGRIYDRQAEDQQFYSWTEVTIKNVDEITETNLIDWSSRLSWELWAQGYIEIQDVIYSEDW